MNVPARTSDWQRRSYSCFDPSTQWMLSGCVRSAIFSTHRIRCLLVVRPDSHMDDLDIDSPSNDVLGEAEIHPRGLSGATQVRAHAKGTECNLLTYCESPVGARC